MVGRHHFESGKLLSVREQSEQEFFDGHRGPLGPFRFAVTLL